MNRRTITWSVPVYALVLAILGWTFNANAALSISAATVNGGATTTVVNGGNVTISYSVVVTGGGDEVEGTRWLISTTAPGTATCADSSPDSANNTNGTFSTSMTVQAPATAGTYNLYLIANDADNCGGGTNSATYLMAGAVIVLDEINITSATVNGGASVTVAPGATISVAYDAEVRGGNDEIEGTFWYIGTSSPGAMICTDSTPDSPNNTNGSYSTGLSVTAPASPGTYNLYLMANDADNCSGSVIANLFTLSNAIVIAAPTPTVSSINRNGTATTYPNSSISWTVTFNIEVTGVDVADFALLQAGGATGATITSVTGSGATRTVTANSGTGTAGTVSLRLVDNDTIVNSASVTLAAAADGSFTGQSYSLLAPVCSGDSSILFCDDFERSSAGGVGSSSYGAWTVTPGSISNCTGTAGNTGCAGIDSDIPPFTTPTNPRPNTTRAMFTRWNTVSVDTPVVNLGGKPGARLTFWMRRGGDAFSEYPEAAGEDYLVQYKDSAGVWKALGQYPTGVLQGEVFIPTIQLPPDALHANFQLRFYQPTGSGKTGSGGAPGVVGYDYWHIDDVVIREFSTSAYVGAFCDNFEGGLGRWSITAEGAPTTAAIGEASLGTLTNQSPTHSLDLRWGYVVASTLTTDLTGVTGNITYWVRSGTTTARDPDSGEDLLVEYFNSSGNWTTLATYLGSAAAGTVYNGSHAIPADAKHANFRLRFRMLNGSNYNNDYWHVDDACVGDAIPTADLAISKTRVSALVPGSNVSYQIGIVNNGPGELSGSMQVVDTLPSQLSFVSATGTGWTCSANGQIVTCNWSGTLANGASAPTITITAGLSSTASGTITNTATVTGAVVDNVSGNNSASVSDSVTVAAFVITDGPCTNGVAIGSGGCNLVNWSPQVSGVAKTNLYITVVNSSGVPTQLSGSVPTDLNLQYGLSCHNPTANAGIQATFSATASALPLCTASGATPTVWTTAAGTTFAAGSPSAGPYSFNYEDVGLVELFVRNSSATSQIGQSGSFAVKPFYLVATATDAAGNANPGTTTAGSKFVAAGEDFTVNVQSFNALGDVTPNFGNETTPPTVSFINSSNVAGNIFSLVVPTLNSPSSGTLTTGTSANGNGGAVTGTVKVTGNNWDEVGAFTLKPYLSDYLGGGAVIGNQSGTIGRFVPYQYALSGTLSTCGSGSFVYVGEPLTGTLTVTAQSKDGVTTTTNYGKGVSLATLAASELTLGGVSAGVSIDTASSLYKFAYKAANDFDSLANGTALIDASIPLKLATSPATPVSTALQVMASTDEVTQLKVSPYTLTASTSVRSGRLRLFNAFGSEKANLAMPLQAQYWSGNSWVLNSLDSCTSLNSNVFNLIGAKAGTSASAVTISGGNGILTLSMPTAVAAPATSTGSVDVAVNLGASGSDQSCLATHGGTAAGLPWLRSQNGSKYPDGTACPTTYDRDPSARATFGIYAPEKKKTVHIRELY